MKRRKLLRYLEQQGCYIRRQGGRHTIMFNPANNQKSPVARHPEIDPNIARRICKQLAIPLPAEK